MSFINYSSKEINCKIVYYGPGLCGKTTNLQYIHKRMNPHARGKMISLATETERTLFFDFLPVAQGYDPDRIPMVMQYNKRDIEHVSSVAELHALINYRNVSEYEAVATTGVGG